MVRLAPFAVAHHLDPCALGNTRSAKQTGVGVAKRVEINPPTPLVLNGHTGRNQILLQFVHARNAIPQNESGPRSANFPKQGNELRDKEHRRGAFVLGSGGPNLDPRLWVIQMDVGPKEPFQFPAP
jgi:hypothetical protein